MEDGRLSEHLMRRDLEIVQLRREIRELTRQRDDARDLVARSGYFIDCEKGAGQDCVMWHSAGRHQGHAPEAILDEVARLNGGAS